MTFIGRVIATAIILHATKIGFEQIDKWRFRRRLSKRYTPHYEGDLKWKDL